MMADKYDDKSDVLSLGIIAYEMLTGLPLFTSDEAQGQLNLLLKYASYF